MIGYNGANRGSKAVLHVLNKFGRGRKSGGARATGATPSLAPLYIYIQKM